MQKNKRLPLLMGIITIVAGLFITLVSADVIHTDPESIHAPRWVLTLAGLVFALSGLAIVSQALSTPSELKSPILRWVQYFIGLGIFVSFTLSFLWIGFGPGERQFSSSVSFLFINFNKSGDDILGRIVFGGCGILGGLLTVYYVWTEARKIITDTSDQE
jgi:hypothetical protein